MPSIRKRYNGNGSEAPTVEPVSPVEKAEQAAIQEKISEQAAVSPLTDQIKALKAAEQKQRAQATEPAPQMPQMPDAVRAWAEKHPDYFSDPVLYAEWNLACTKTWRDGIHDWSAPEFVPALERHLEHLSPASPAPAPAPTPEPTPKSAAPEEAPTTPDAPQAPRPASQVPPTPAARGFALPPSRDPPSMSTGRPAGASTVTLTAEQSAFARSQGLSDEQYKRELIRMEAEKRAGVRQ
jgi:hypothetical protein